jgi:hypothetical protein
MRGWWNSPGGLTRADASPSLQDGPGTDSSSPDGRWADQMLGSSRPTDDGQATSTSPPTLSKWHSWLDSPRRRGGEGAT